MSDENTTFAADLVDRNLGHRLKAAGAAPGLRDATVALTAKSVETEELGQLVREQLEQLRHPSSRAVPDAYLAYDAAAENALQHAAAGLRLALAQNGQLVEGQLFEDSLARDLSDDPRTAIRAELARIPRPTTRPAPLRWSIDPVPWAADETSPDTMWPPPGLEETSDLRSIPDGAAAVARIERGPHAGWVQIGLVERQSTFAQQYPQRPQRSVMVATGIELTDHPRLDQSLPFTSKPRRLWTTARRELGQVLDPADAAVMLGTRDQPVVALPELDEGACGAGEAPLLLVPTFILIAALELDPTPGTCGLSLSDLYGPALVGRLWRGHPVHDGHYEPSFPAAEGADLLLRPDLFERLEGAAGGDRLCLGVSISYYPHEQDGPEPGP